MGFLTGSVLAFSMVVLSSSLFVGDPGSSLLFCDLGGVFLCGFVLRTLDGFLIWGSFLRFFGFFGFSAGVLISHGYFSSGWFL